MRSVSNDQRRRITDEGGGGSGERAVPENSGPTVLDLIKELLDGVLAFHLHLGLERVHCQTNEGNVSLS
jgi:hypothetical protein